MPDTRGKVHTSQSHLYAKDGPQMTLHWDPPDSNRKTMGVSTNDVWKFLHVLEVASCRWSLKAWFWWRWGGLWRRAPWGDCAVFGTSTEQAPSPHQHIWHSTTCYFQRFCFGNIVHGCQPDIRTSWTNNAAPQTLGWVELLSSYCQIKTFNTPYKIYTSTSIVTPEKEPWTRPKAGRT